MTHVDVTANFTTARLARLETRGIAGAVTSDAAAIRRMLDQFLARVENRLIEGVLMRRLRRAYRVSSSEMDARAMLSSMRGAYDTGTMETLPSFMPSALRDMLARKPPVAPGGRPSENDADIDRPCLIYTVGGGFILPPSRRQKTMVQRFAEVVGCEVVLGQHRLAPEDPFPAAAHDIAAQFRAMVKAGRPADCIFMAADTAGASVTLGAIQLLRDEGHDLPAGVILFCPWCDLSLSGWSYITRSMTSESPFRMETAAFCARMYLQDHNPTDPLASAVFADLADFPPILIHTSRNDLHFDDALRLAEAGARAGCDMRLNYWDSPRHHMERLACADATHSFQIARTFIERHMRP